MLNKLLEHGIGVSTGVKLEEIEKKIVAEQLAISSMTRSGTTVTASINSHNLVVGSVIEIIGANQAEYNGTHIITAVPSTSQVQFIIVGTPVTPATGSFYALKKSGFSVSKGDKLIPFMGGVAPCEEVFDYSPVHDYSNNLIRMTFNYANSNFVDKNILHFKDNKFIHYDYNDSSQIIISILEVLNGTIYVRSSFETGMTVIGGASGYIDVIVYSENKLIMVRSATSASAVITEFSIDESDNITAGNSLVMSTNSYAGWGAQIVKLQDGQLAVAFNEQVSSVWRFRLYPILYNGSNFTVGAPLTIANSDYVGQIHRISDNKIAAFHYNNSLSKNELKIISVVNNVASSITAVSGFFYYQASCSDFAVLGEDRFVVLSSDASVLKIQHAHIVNNVLYLKSAKPIPHASYNEYSIEVINSRTDTLSCLLSSKSGTDITSVAQLSCLHFKAIDEMSYMIGADLIYSESDSTYGHTGMRGIAGNDVLLFKFRSNSSYDIFFGFADKGDKRRYIAKENGNIGDTIKVYKI